MNFEKMKRFFGEMKSIITDWRCAVPVLVTALLSFGLQLTRFNIGVDDMVRFRYLNGGLFSQGRFASPVVSYMFGFVKAFPFFEPFLGVLFLIASAFLMILLFKRASGGKLYSGVLTVLACVFLSYPLINEIFVYKGSDLYTGVGYFLTVVALLTVTGIFDKKEIAEEQGTAAKKSPVKGAVIRLCVTALIMMFTVSMYEAFAPVYLVLASLYVFTKILFGPGKMPGERSVGKDAKGPRFIREYLTVILPAAIGIVLEFLIGLVVTSVVDFGSQIPAGSSIYIPEEFSASYFTDMFYQIFRKFYLAGLWYLPIGFFVFCGFLAVCAFIITGIVKKRWSGIVPAVGTFIGLFGIAFLTGGSVKYRTCLSFAPFVAYFIALLVFLAGSPLPGLRDKASRIGSQVAAILIICAQILSLNLCFYGNDVRWQEEKAVLIDCGEALCADESFDIAEKPVIFIGDYRLSDKALSFKYVRADDPLYTAVKKGALAMGFHLETTDLDDTFVLATCQSDFGSVISWGIHDSFSCNEELLLVFRELGYEFIPGTAERYDELTENIDAFPVFNETGIITELDDCIVVRLK